MVETTEDFQRIEAIFSEALSAPSESRAEVIGARCDGDRVLEAEVWSLLEACAAEERLAASHRLEAGAGREAQAESRQIGPYLLDRLLGRGGMGAVYLAHRADGHFEQQVAIKLIDLPLATAVFKKRFRQERQILAGLQHPYIARLLDGGVTAAGELYLVMEYVDGVPIHRFCEEHGLSVAQRLALFLRVCEAVQFAHQNFVVHRDLKPDNILVDEDGMPRLLDFGTAKILSPTQAFPGSELTREGNYSFTPQYASPEQVLGNPITTASDTYSLGVLLYLLLTGAKPYEFKELTTGEMLRVICEEAPRRPAEAAGSGKRFDADLEAILDKALRKEPKDRYLTAEQLANDLRAFLEEQPVGARQGTLRYRAGKFVRRHRLALASAALLAVTLFAGIVGVMWQAKVANAERRKAEARSADLRQLSNSLLTDLDEVIQQIPGSTGAQKLLVTSVIQHMDRMASEARGDRQSQLDLANAYTQLGNLQGNAYHQNLGDPTGALVSVDKAIALSMPFTNGNSKDSEALHALAKAQLSRGQILFGSAPIQQAIDSTRAAIASYDRLMDLAGATPDVLSEMAVTYTILGDEQGNIITESLNDLPAATSAYRRSLDLYNRALSIDPNLISARRGLATSLLDIVPTEKESDPEQALKDVQLALQRIAALPSEEQGTLRMIRIRNTLIVDKAFVLAQLGRYSEANALMVGTVQASMRRAATDPQDLRALADLAFSLDREAMNYEVAADPALGASNYDRQRNLAAAEKALAQELADLEHIVRLNPSQSEWKPVLADVQVRLGSIQSILHGSDNSAELVKKGLATLRELVRKGQNSPEILDTTAKNFLIAEPASLRDPQLAVSCAEHAVASSHHKTPAMLLTLAQAYRATGDFEKSRAAASEGLALLPAPQPGSVKPRLRKLLEIQAEPKN